MNAGDKRVDEAKGEVAEIRIGVQGAAGIVTLDRPRALNALTTAMRAEMAS